MTGTNADGAALQLRVSALPETTYSQGHFPLRLTFVNRGNARVCILGHFLPLPVFFSFDLVKEDGTPIILPGAGKIDFGRQSPPSIELEPGGTWSVVVDLGSLIAEELPAGVYVVSATYHNQYGENCFRGYLRSNTIRINLV